MTNIKGTNMSCPLDIIQFVIQTIYNYFILVHQFLL